MLLTQPTQLFVQLQRPTQSVEALLQQHTTQPLPSRLRSQRQLILIQLFQLRLPRKFYFLTGRSGTNDENRVTSVAYTTYTTVCAVTDTFTVSGSTVTTTYYTTSTIKTEVPTTINTYTTLPAETAS